jgi:uncharacterized protein with HEPN domain
MWKDDAYLLDMLLASRDVQRFLQDADEARFRADEVLHYAVMQRLTVVGEAASKVSPPTRDAHPEIPWKQIVGMRNILVHAYGKVRIEIVRDVATNGVAQLIAAIEPLVPPEDDSPPVADVEPENPAP